MSPHIIFCVVSLGNCIILGQKNTNDIHQEMADDGYVLSPIELKIPAWWSVLMTQFLGFLVIFT